MHRRKKYTWFISVIVAILLAAFILPSSAAQGEPDQKANGLVYKEKITPADQKAAGKKFKEQGGVTAAAAALVTDPATGYLTPDYFADANWAYSPLPGGSIGSVTVISGGSGYSAAPIVTITDVYGPGTGATASATVVGGVITAITLDTAGTGYVAPVVTISDNTGTGAEAGAALDPATLTGGLRKFMDALPGLGAAGANALGQYIPVAVPDTTSYPGSDYYEIALLEYSEKMHSDLPPTKLRGYVQLETSEVVAKLAAAGTPSKHIDVGGGHFAVDNPHYLGPAIVATGEAAGQQATAVRIKFYNLLPTGAGGDLFLPVDTTVMGSGMAPNGTEEYSQNRATLHLHGTDTVWISDGTPHQWTTPAGETTSYPQGVSVVPVPDMGAGTAAGDTGDPTDGVMTFYYTNQHSARLMFYHDHAWGITRLNVYVGEAAAYVVADQVEADLINGTNLSGVNPGLAKVLPTVVDGVTDYGIPLVVQDKTWVDANTILKSDPTWAWGTGAIDPATSYPTPNTGDLWYPHVYVPAQNPYDPGGSNPFGRWHYAAWFWPPASNLEFPPVPNPYYDPVNAPWEAPFIPGTPNPSAPGEAFMDTPTVNGTAYPYLNVEPKSYRFRILNAADDRFFNFQWYVADPGVVTTDGRTNTEVRMVPAPDGREGGVPDSAMKGPDWIQIGTEGGFLPKPVVIPGDQYVTWNGDPTLFNFGNVQDHSLLLGTAERADVIVDFSQYAGKTLILYNDAPTAFPANIPQYDYYTGAPDRTDIGGAPAIHAGFGPNVRTIMQVRVGGTAAGSTLSSVNVTAGGNSYTSPSVAIVPSAGDTTGAGATASAVGAVDRVSLNNMGSGYTAAAVTIGAPDDPAGIQAAATATIVGGFVTGITVTNGGSGYFTAPLVTIPGDGAGAAAQAALTLTGITLTAPGSGYTLPPVVVITDTGTGSGAIAVASLVASGTALPPYDLAALEAAFAKTAAKNGVFEVSQDPIIIPTAEYNSAYNASFPADAFVRQHDNSFTFQSTFGASATLPIQAKAIQDEMGEVFDPYGRMMGMLGLELPVTTPGAQNFMMYGYTSPPVEIIKGVYASQIGATEDGTQIWRITHNGVDTHTIHVHMYNAQLINRVAWDGFVYPPDPNELGWKETFRVNPLEHTIIALRAVVPENLPFEVPNSSRLIDPSMMDGMPLEWPGPAGFFDPLGNPVTSFGAEGVINNHLVNFGWEYVYHCHLLAHEEMDMMHGVVIAAPPSKPTGLTVTLQGSRANLRWTDVTNETGYTIQRATNAGFTTGLVTYKVGANTTTFLAPGNLKKGTTYYYRVLATNTVGDTMTPNFPTMTVDSTPSSTVSITR